jgi:hypothetical protein
MKITSKALLLMSTVLCVASAPEMARSMDEEINNTGRPGMLIPFSMYHEDNTMDEIPSLLRSKKTTITVLPGGTAPLSLPAYALLRSEGRLTVLEGGQVEIIP